MEKPENDRQSLSLTKLNHIRDVMKPPIRILRFEDVEKDVELIEQELVRAQIGFTSKQVTKEEDFIKEVKRFSPDLILSDYSFPSLPGIDPLILAREQRSNQTHFQR